MTSRVLRVIDQCGAKCLSHRTSVGHWLATTPFAVAIFISAAAAQAKVEVTENFDVGTGTRFETFQGNNPAPLDLSASLTSPSNMSSLNMGFGDEVLNYSAVKTNQFGLTTTNHVGQANGSSGAGEFGGQFNWLSYGYGADVNIGNMTIGAGTQADPIKIQATLLLQDVGFQNDETVTIGYFTENLGLNPETQTLNPVGDADDMRRADGFGLNPHTTISAGIGFIGDARFFLYINGSDSPVIDLRGQPTDPVAVGSLIDIDLNVFCFECEDGVGTGVIMGTVNGHSVAHARAADANDVLMAFGIGQAFRNRENPPLNWRRSVAFIDDVTYSVDGDGGIDNPTPFRFEPLAVGNGGDYNGDDNVDAADYVIWRKNVGSSGTPGSVFGDGTGDDLSGTPDGDVDQFDYDFWRSKFGDVVADSGDLSSVGVPEPASALLLVLGGFGLRSFVRRAR